MRLSELSGKKRLDLLVYTSGLAARRPILPRLKHSLTAQDRPAPANNQ